MDEEDDLIAKGGTTAQLWLALEVSRERRHWLPWEQDPEDCEDPERMVPLEELSPHLFILESVEEKFYLVLQFLWFLGVPEIEDSSCQELQSSKNPESISAKTGDIFRPLIIETLYDAKLFGNHLCKEQNDVSTDILSFDAVGPSITESLCDDYYLFLCRAVQQAATVFHYQHRKFFTLLHIKILSTHYQVKAQRENKAKMKSLEKDIKKKIKNTLKSEEFRMCLPIYKEYGKMEEVMGHVAEAENVYATALTIGTASGNALDPDSEDFRAVMDLYSSYIHLELNCEAEVCSSHHSNNVLQTLCSLINEGKFVVPDGSPATGGNLLKARKKLLEVQDHYGHIWNGVSSCGTVKENEKILAIKVVTFLALIQLLTTGFRSACLMFESIIEKVSNAVPHKLEDITLPTEKKPNPKKKDKSKDELAKVLESLYEDYLWITEASRQLGHLVKDGKMSPVCLRSVLAAALKAAPENLRFQLLLAKNQVSVTLFIFCTCMGLACLSFR